MKSPETVAEWEACKLEIEMALAGDLAADDCEYELAEIIATAMQEAYQLGMAYGYSEGKKAGYSLGYDKGLEAAPKQLSLFD